MRGALLALAQQGVAADEVALVEGDEALEPGLQRRPVGRQVRAPQPVALLEAHRLERPVAEVDETEVLAGLVQQVVQRPLRLDRMVQLPAELTHVRDPHREHARASDLDVAGAEEGEPRVGEVVARDPLQQLARAAARRP